MLHDFILNHIIISSIIFVLVCVFEAFLAFKKKWIFATIMPSILFLLLIPRILYMVKGGHFLTDFVLLRLTAFLIISLIFIVCRIIRNNKKKIQVKNDIEKMEISDLGE